VRPGGCGNDPRAQLTDGDRAAIADFRRYLELTHQRDAGAELGDDDRAFLAAYAAGDQQDGDPPA
jgi:hypothetical protein